MERSIALGALFLLIPKFFGVLVFHHVVVIAFIICDPTAIASKGELVPIALATFFPLLFVALCEADAGVAVKVNADGDWFIVNH